MSNQRTWQAMDTRKGGWHPHATQILSGPINRGTHGCTQATQIKPYEPKAQGQGQARPTQTLAKG